MKKNHHLPSPKSKPLTLISFFVLLLCNVYATAKTVTHYPLGDSDTLINIDIAAKAESPYKSPSTGGGGDKTKAAEWIKEDKTGFIENKGQIKDENGKLNKRVKYLLTMRGLNVQLRATGFSYDAYVEEASGDGRRETGDGRQKPIGLQTSDSRLPTSDFKYHRVDIELQNANPNATLITEYPLAEVTNVFNELGSFENIHSYKKITYKDIYQGIDLEFLAQKGTEKPIEYNFIIHAGADASQIKMHYNSGGDISLQGGAIKMKLAFGMLEEKIPESYIQQTKQSLAVHYKATDDAQGMYAFSVPNYDKTKTLVIDPTPSLVWATYYGGTADEAISSVVVDASGNVYIAGYTTSTTNIATVAPAFQSSFSGLSPNTDAFVAAFTSSGVRLWGTYYGVSSSAESGSLTISGNFIYLAGATSGVTVPATVGQTIYGGGTFDGFIVKFNTSNGSRVWSTYCGGAGNDKITSLAVAPDGNVYVTGNTTSAAAFATTGPAFTGTISSFLAKISSAGVKTWCTYYQGGSASGATAVAVDGNNNPYISGFAQVGASPLQGYLARFDAAAGSLTWGNNFGGFFLNLAVDNTNGYFYAAGYTSNIGLGTPGTFQPTLIFGIGGGIFAKFDLNGNQQWATYLVDPGSGGNDEVTSIALDNAGNPYVLGQTYGTIGDTTLATNCSYQPVKVAASNSMFLDKFSTAGVRVWGTYIGTGGETQNIGYHFMDIDQGNNNIYVGFYTSSGSIATTAGSWQPNYNGGVEGVLMKFNDGTLPSNFTVSASVVSPLTQNTCSLGLPQTIIGNSINATNPPNFTSGIFYQWQTAPSPTGPWTNITGETFKDFTPPPGSSGTVYFRRLIKANNTYCILTTVDSSAVASLTIAANTAPTANADGPEWFVCPSGNVMLNGSGIVVPPATTITSYQWYTGGSTTPTAITASFTPTNITVATTYTLKVTDNNGCSGLNQVTITPVAANVGTPAASFCQGSSGVQIGAAPVASSSIAYNWTTMSGTPAAIALSCTSCAQPIASPAVTSVYKLTVTVTQKSGALCISSSNVTVTPVQAPNNNTNFAGPDETICKNTTVTLGTAVDPTVTSYAWTPGTYLTSTAVAQPTFQAGTTTAPCPISYTVTAAKSGCTFQDYVNVSVIDMNIDKGGQTVCTPLWVSASTPGANCSGAVYTWHLISGSGIIVNTRNGGADAYLEATGSLGSSAVFNRTTTLNGVTCTSQNVTVSVCAAIACASVTIVPLSNQGCPKVFGVQPLQLGVTGITTADYNFSWTPVNLVDNPTAPTVNIASTGQATISVTVTNKYDPTISCTASLLINNPLWALPVVIISDKYTCPGKPVQIGTTNVAGYTYAWSPGLNLDNAGISNPTATVNNTSIYTLLVNETATGCKLYDTMKVNVSTIVFDAGPDRGVCISGIATLGSTPGGSYTYAWSPPLSAWQNGTDQTFANPQVLFSGTSQTLSVIVNDPLTGCTFDDTVTLTNSVTPGTYASTSPSPFCPGGSVQLGVAPIDSVTYFWSPGATLSCTACSNPIATPTSSPTLYTVTASYPGCVTPATDTVTVMWLPTTPFDFTDKTICPNTPTNIGVGGAGNPASILGAVSYNWSPSSGLSCNACASPNANPASATTYTCVITFSDGCTASDNVTVTPFFAVSAKPDAVICAGGSAILGSPSVAGVTYNWSVTSGTLGSIFPTNAAQPTANPTVTSVYHLVATGAGCTVTDDAQVIVNVPLPFTIAGNPIVCTGGSATLGFTPSVANYTYQWTPTTNVASPNSSQTLITPSASQVYKLVETDLTTGCSSSQQILVVVNSNPIVATGGTVSVCSNTGTMLPLTVTSPSGTYTYSWASTAFLSNPYIQNPITFTSANTTYTATITDNATNCQLAVQSNLIVGLCAVALSGNVFHDGNGQTDNTVNTSGAVTAIPANLYASLVDGSDNILATVLVNPNGTYNFNTVPAGNYSIVLTTDPAGSVTPVLPAGWNGTGAILGTGTGSVGANNVLPNVNVATINVTNANFGIEQPPVPNPQSYFILQPGYGSVIPLTGTGSISSPAPLSGNDLEDGVKGAGSTFTVTDTTALNGNGLLYNELPVVPGTPIPNYNPVLLSVVYSGYLSTDLSFDYTVTDAAGEVGPSVIYSIVWIIPLSQHLLDFSAIKSGQSALLNWSTSQEIGSSYFGIERNSGGSWVQIGRVTATGNSSVPQYYSFLDNKPYPGFDDYRLQLVNKDGSATYSVTRTLNFGANTRTTVMPNPANSTLYIIDAPASAELTLLDATGRVLMQRTTQANSESVDMSSLVRGFYFLELRDKTSGALLSSFQVIKE